MVVEEGRCVDVDEAEVQQPSEARARARSDTKARGP